MKRTGFIVALFALLSASLLLDGSRASATPPGAAVNFAALEQDMLSELNLARQRPAEYAAYLEALRPMFAGKEYRRPGKPGLMTEEGAAALEEAIRFMRAARPAAPLTPATGMCSGARDLVKEQGTSGATGHKGADGSFCEQRSARYGAWKEPIGENLSYGDDAARERVLTLLIDDGFASRGHRLRIMNPDFKVAGIACGEHKLGAMCVITLAGGFTDKSSAAGTTKPAPAAAKRL